MAIHILGPVTNQSDGLARALSYEPIAYAASIDLDMEAVNSQARSIALTGDLALSAINLSRGKSVVLRLVTGAADRSVTLPIDWKVFGINPDTLLANKVYRATIECWGATEADVDIAIAEQI